MQILQHQHSRAFRLTASLFLSAIYFVFAVGIWATHGSLNIAASTAQRLPGATSSNSSTPNQILVETGGSLGFNLLVATFLAVGTTYIFLRRSHDVE